MARRGLSRNQLLGGLSPREFLARHWQKKPLLVRGAFPGFRDPLTQDELAGLALEDGIESRLIFGKGKKRRFAMERGPFPESVLRALPTSHWTLLVQEVDRYVPAAAAILDRFDFVPRWRLDDVMVSFAPPFGTVGAHVDSYDVFLIQGMGRRRWQIAATFDPKLVKGIDLKVLANFEAEQEWILEPGDMLYLPPGVAHYGVALENCMTYSVGFRAPTAAHLVDTYFQFAAEPHDDRVTQLLGDQGRALVSAPGSIGKADLARVRALLAATFDDDDHLARWFLGQSTAVKEPGVAPSAAQARRAAASFWRRVSDADVALFNGGPRRAYYAGRDGRLFFFLGGREMELPKALLPLAKLAAETKVLPAPVFLALVKSKKITGAAKDFLDLLVQEGALDCQ